MSMQERAKAAAAPAANRKKQHRKQKRQQKLVVLGVIIIVLALIYVIGAVFFSKHFFPNTVINGISCGWKNAESSTKQFEKAADQYVLTLVERDGQTEEIKSADMDLAVDPQSALEEMIENQSGFTWIFHVFGENESEIETAVTYDETKLSARLDELTCMDESQMIDSENASLSEYQQGSGFEIVAAVHGTRINSDVFHEQLRQAITAFTAELNLAEAGCYIEPEYTEDSDEAQAMLEAANKYAAVTITYEFGDNKEVIDGTTISSWIQVDENMNVSLNQDVMAQYVKDLAKTYDTKWKSRTITTHSGKTVTVPAGGNYGWRMNQEETLAALNASLESGEDYTGEVVWYQTAAQFGEQDYGSTYIEVSISAQHMWYYVNGSVALESDFVSGDVSKGHDTPKGAYRIAYKARDQELKGQGYSSPVSYWMPFVDGCGFHDANWRDRFGGSIYLSNGSHGCLNMPPANAKALYELIEAGTAVLIY